MLDDKKRNYADLSLGVPGLPGEDNVSLEDGRRVEQVPDHCLNIFSKYLKHSNPLVPYLPCDIIKTRKFCILVPIYIIFVTHF